MTWLAFLFAVEIGYATAPAWLSEVTHPVYTDQVIQVAPEETVYTTLEAEVLIMDLLFFNGAVTTYSAPVKATRYAPYQADYWFGAGVQYGGITAGWRHICQHGVLSSMRQDVGYMFGGGDILYVRYEGRVN